MGPFLLSLRPPPQWGKDCGQNVVPQDFQDQALSRQEAEAKQAHPAVDQNEDWQQDQVQLQEETLEEDKAWPVSMWLFVFGAPVSPSWNICQYHHLLGPDLEKTPCHLKPVFFCTDILVIFVWK